jgi:hypothetical protein
VKSLVEKYERMLELRSQLTGPPDANARAKMKALAKEFPGALRELDSLPTEEIERRIQQLRSGADEPWMRWMARYHELMRAALLIRAGKDGGVDPEFAEKVASPAHGRLMVVVFDRIAAEEGLDRGEIWDAVFPPRKGRRDYRHG